MIKGLGPFQSAKYIHHLGSALTACSSDGPQRTPGPCVLLISTPGDGPSATSMKRQNWEVSLLSIMDSCIMGTGASFCASMYKIAMNSILGDKQEDDGGRGCRPIDKGECCYLYLFTYYLYKNGKMFLQAEPMVLRKLN